MAKGSNAKSKVKMTARRYLRRITGVQIFFIAFLTLISAVAVLPIVYIVNDAFKPMRELFLYPPRFFVMSPTLQNFRDLIIATKLSIVPFSRFLFNSVSVAVVTVFLTIVISSMCAYALSKHSFPGKKMLFSIIVLSLMFVAEAVQITRYILICRLGMLNTYFAHILPYLAMPVGVFLMKQFIDQIPDSLLEAAKIDGAKEGYIFLNVILPLSKAAVGTVFILAFQSIWTNVESSNIYMHHEAMKNIPYFVNSLTSGLANTVARRGASAAGGLLLFLPNLIIVFILKKSMIDALVHSGIK